MEPNLYNKEAEQAVIGSILLTEGKCIDDLHLSPDDFSDNRLAGIYRVARKKFLNHEPVDPITLTADTDFQQLKISPVVLHELTGATPTSESVGYYAELVYQSAIRRRVSQAVHQIGVDAQNIDFAQLTETARKKLDDALGVRKQAISFIDDEIAETIDSMNQPSKAYPTPWGLLTRAIGGFRAGGLYTIGARPGKGKTSIGLQCAMTLSKSGAVAFSSLEMNRSEIHKRIISIGASVPMESVMNNNLTEYEWKRIASHKEEIRPNIAIDDRAEVSIFDIRSFARSVARVMPLKAVVVDYLQLISSRDNRPRHELVAEMSRQLKIMARDLDVPVIALSQLNRQSELRTDKKPSLADLRESGAIEQDSDVVILLHQEENTVLLDVAKNRQGPPSMVRLRWEGEFARATS